MVSEKSELQSMLERLSRVERQNRRIKSSGLVFLAGLATVFLMGQSSTPKVSAVSRHKSSPCEGKTGLAEPC
jgi:hypothetical protein